MKSETHPQLKGTLSTLSVNMLSTLGGDIVAAGVEREGGECGWVWASRSLDLCAARGQEQETVGAKGKRRLEKITWI